MRIAITKGTNEDRLVISREDGSRVATSFPKKGPIPHDGVHVIVERELGLRRAFWGFVADGRHPEEIARLTAQAGHPSASRAREPHASIVELIQAERLVECFEAEVWGGASELAVLQSVADAAMAQSRVALVLLPAAPVERIRKALSALSADWNALKAGETLQLEWPEIT